MLTMVNTYLTMRELRLYFSVLWLHRGVERPSVRIRVRNEAVPLTIRTEQSRWIICWGWCISIREVRVREMKFARLRNMGA